jgi:MFS family permease
MIVSMGGLSGGQLLLNVGDPGGFTLFVVASALVSLSLVPVVLSATSAPPLTIAQPMSLRQLARTAPTGVVSSFFGGAGAGTIMALGAIYGAQVGRSDGRIALLLAAPMFGGVVFQFPVGWLADRLPRLSMIIAMAALAVAASAALLVVDSDSDLALVAIFVLGGGMFPLYSLTVAYTNDALRPEQMIAAGATLVRVNGSGSLFGPLVGAAAMAVVGPRSIFWVILGLHVVVIGFATSRLLTGARSPRPRGHVSPFPIRSGAGAVYLLVKRRGGEPLG